ncbi:DUF4190 domain-containing protein [Saccharopolyspora sp. NPDC002376]
MTYPYDPNAQYYQAPQPYGMGYPQPPRNNGMAIASMCVSLASILMCHASVVVGPVGAILGHVSLREIKRNPQAYTNRGMALTGIIVGWSLFAVWASIIAFLILAATGLLGSALEAELSN